MKNKRNTYLLLAAAVVVWGFLAYKVVVAFKGDDEPVVQHNFQPVNMEESVAVADTFNLVLDYADPFLGKSFQPKQTYTPPKTNVKKVTPKKEPVKIKVRFPKMTYKGKINSKTSVLAIIDINNVEHFGAVGQTIEGVTIVEIGPDSLTIKYREAETKIGKAF